ncbi:MAG: hypothetical protein ACI8RA_000343 [Chlamydiales bacterium]|jgi:hypothetical protein
MTGLNIDSAYQNLAGFTEQNAEGVMVNAPAAKGSVSLGSKGINFSGDKKGFRNLATFTAKVIELIGKEKTGENSDKIDAIKGRISEVEAEATKAQSKTFLGKIANAWNKLFGKETNTSKLTKAIDAYQENRKLEAAEVALDSADRVAGLDLKGLRSESTVTVKSLGRAKNKLGSTKADLKQAKAANKLVYVQDEARITTLIKQEEALKTGAKAGLEAGHSVKNILGTDRVMTNQQIISSSSSKGGESVEIDEVVFSKAAAKIRGRQHDKRIAELNAELSQAKSDYENNPEVAELEAQIPGLEENVEKLTTVFADLQKDIKTAVAYKNEQKHAKAAHRNTPVGQVYVSERDENHEVVKGSEYVSGVKVQTPATRAKLAKLQAKDLTNLERRFNESAEKRANVIMDTISTGAKKGQPEYLELAQKLRTEFSDWQLGHNSELIGKIDGFLATAESDIGAAKDEVAAFRQERKDAMADGTAAHTAAAAGMTFNPKGVSASVLSSEESFGAYQGRISTTVDVNKAVNARNSKHAPSMSSVRANVGFKFGANRLDDLLKKKLGEQVKPSKPGKLRSGVATVAAGLRFFPGGHLVVGRPPVVAK